MKEKICEALNEQIKHELYASHLYLSIASFLETIPLEGMSSWFRGQAEEEHEHAMKIYDYLIDRNVHVDMRAIDKPKGDFESVLQVFELARDHERKVTSWIHRIYELASEEKDYATKVFMHWFITEQVEEEKNAEDNYDQVKYIGDDKSALFVLDQNFAKKAEAE